MFKITLSRQQGFTFLELILVIFIIGIIAVGSTQFIVNSVRGLNDVSRRAAVASSVQISIAKIERQITHSLLHSVRLKTRGDTQCLEMLPIKSRAFFAKVDLQKPASKLLAISLSQSVIGLRAVIPSSITATYYQDPRAKDSGPVSSHIKTQQPTDNKHMQLLTFDAAHQFGALSKKQLLYFVAQPLSYCLQQGRLMKYTNYGYHPQQLLPDKLPNSEPQQVLMAKDLLGQSQFSYSDQHRTLDIEIQLGDSSESLLINRRLWLTNE